MYPWRVGCRGLGGGAGEHGVHDRVLARGGQLLGEGRQTHSGQTVFFWVKTFFLFYYDQNLKKAKSISEHSPQIQILSQTPSLFASNIKKITILCTS